MSKHRYKVRDSKTGLFWNGDARWSRFTNDGKYWSNRETAENAVNRYLLYSSHYRKEETYRVAPKYWEVCEFELVEREKQTFSLSESVIHADIKNQLGKVSSQYSSFYDRMRKLGVENKINFIFKLKPAEHEYSAGAETIKSARAQLRLLGVKTRTFREYWGMFGMMNRDQAMKARLSMDVESIVDLSEIRQASYSKFGLDVPSNDE